MILKSKSIFSPFQVEQLSDIYSPILSRSVIADVYIPSTFKANRKKYPLLVLNDGQDSDAVRLKSTLSRLIRSNEISEVVVVAVHAGDRMQEYGVADQPDYKSRGNKAKLYAAFLIEELLPVIKTMYRVDLHHKNNTIAGFSLGGLSAFDVAWHHPEIFKKAGAFSGSFWWRTKSYSEGYEDAHDRIVHAMVQNDVYRPGLQFWFQTGTEDEPADRNNNGIIDSIDDTLDLIVELTRKGYRPFYDIEYMEIEGGNHSQKTWAKAMPHFLKWAFEK